MEESITVTSGQAGEASREEPTGKTVCRANRSRNNVSSIQKLKLERAVTVSKRKGSFIKDDMLGGDDSICGQIKAAVSFMMSGIAKEDAQGGVRSEFVWSSSGKVRVTLAAKDSKVVVSRRFA